MIVIDRLEHMEQRYNELQAQFSLPEIINDHEKYQKTAKALREIETPVEKYRELKQAQQGIADAGIVAGQIGGAAGERIGAADVHRPGQVGSAPTDLQGTGPRDG